MLLLFIYSGAANSASIEHKLVCKEEGGNEAVELVLSFKEEFFTLLGSDRGCRSEYVYRVVSGDYSVPFIFSYPISDDMGLNAQVMIFAASANDGVAHYIGSIPASASELQDGSFKDIQQSGGSIYESIYRIEGQEVLTLTPGKELMISDEQCVFKEKSGGACQKMRGSFIKPVCVFNYGDRKVLADVKECADMSESL
ncbi:hypothetical protein ICA16_12195 [Pseudomonas anatoliensis]|uniref:hypothetical protein n=1 Tax=Pseudomonas anatoliensis TaxID=2710589 RepID=UPI001B3203E6|nr:hypothetical protein [Pseudomonas anatoliensis]MBP5956426.1 hypothetical protein [Pseudomonas anatoliensis]